MKKVLFILLFGLMFSQVYDPMTGKIIESDSTKVLYDPMTGKIIKSNQNNNLKNQKKTKIKLNNQQINDLAYTHAKTDADARIGFYIVSTTAVGIGSLFASFIIEQPLFLVTPLMPFVAANDKGNYTLPQSRSIEYKFKYDVSNFVTYKLEYEQKRAKIQSTRHFFSSLLGPPATFFASIVVIGLILN